MRWQVQGAGTREVIVTGRSVDGTNIRLKFVPDPYQGAVFVNTGYEPDNTGWVDVQFAGFIIGGEKKRLSVRLSDAETRELAAWLIASVGADGDGKH
jgi:hypothetical protein